MDKRPKKYKILIIEDDLPALNALIEKFSREGFSTLEAKNGEEGLESALKNRPDLILLDIVMPKMDGMTMLKKLREDEWGKHVPIIILTNLNENEKIAEAIAEGSYKYLIKSDWKIEDIVAKVRNQIETPQS